VVVLVVLVVLVLVLVVVLVVELVLVVVVVPEQVLSVWVTLIVSGHVVFSAVQPSAIATQTTGYDDGPTSAGHNFVPDGQFVRVSPASPFSPVSPFAPTSGGGHWAGSWFCPAGPLGGAFITVDANDAVTAGIAALAALDAVTASVLYGTDVGTTGRPRGK
jgi:hypothetical protein